MVNAGRYFPALRESAARRYFAGQSASIVGTWTQTITLNLILWEQTHSAGLLGVLNFLLYGPMLFLPAAFGARLQPATVRVVTLRIVAASGLVSLALCVAAWCGLLRPGAILVTGLAMGVIGAIEMPSRQLLLTTLLQDKSLFVNAVATNTLVFNLGRMLGPAVAALIYAKWGAAWAFGLGSLGVLFMCAMMASLSGVRIPEVRSGGRGSMREAFAHVRRDAFARRFVPLLSCLGIFVSSYQTLIPVLAATGYGDAARFTGLLFGCAGAGSLSAALLLSVALGDAARRQLLAWTPWLCAGALMLIALAPTVVLTALCFWLLGAALTFSTTTINATLQRGCPGHLRGGVVGIYAMAFMGAIPLGHLVIGALAGAVGVRTAFAVMAGGVTICRLLIDAVNRRSSRGEQR